MTNESQIIICKHVSQGQPVDVLHGSQNGVEFAVCFLCADEINKETEQALADTIGICREHAINYGIPEFLPGDLGFWTRQQDRTN